MAAPPPPVVENAMTPKEYEKFVAEHGHTPSWRPQRFHGVKSGTTLKDGSKQLERGIMPKARRIGHKYDNGMGMALHRDAMTLAEYRRMEKDLTHPITDKPQLTRRGQHYKHLVLANPDDASASWSGITNERYKK